MYDNKRLFLVFEYLELDLKKYMDTTPSLAQNRNLIKVFHLSALHLTWFPINVCATVRNVDLTRFVPPAALHLPDAFRHSLLPRPSVSPLLHCKQGLVKQ